MKDERSLPLQSITDVRLHTSYRTLAFGLRCLEVETASARAGDGIIIEGLSRRTALALRERIFQAIQKMQSQPWRPMAEREEHDEEIDTESTPTWNNPGTTRLSSVSAKIH